MSAAADTCCCIPVSRTQLHWAKMGVEERAWGGSALAASRQNFEDIPASGNRGCALRLALGSRVCQIAVPARQQRPQALAAALRRRRSARHALLCAHHRSGGELL